jgi:hypothetical protein
VRGPVAPFVLRLAGWFPVALAVWYLCAPLLTLPLLGIVKAGLLAGAGEIYTNVEKSGSVLSFVTSLRAQRATLAQPTGGVVVVEVDALLYTFGLPLAWALVLAAWQEGWPKRLAMVYLVLLPFQAWGLAADALRQVAITLGPAVASQAGFGPLQRELIVYAYQLGVLVLPTVAPAVFWVATHRRFLESLRVPPA